MIPSNNNDQNKSFSREIITQVLGEIGLTPEEIEYYYLAIGFDTFSFDVLKKIMKNKTDAECKNLAKKFIEKGLFKEISAEIPHYTALPPYSALINQLKKFNDYISEIKSTTPKELDQSFSQLEKQTSEVNKLKSFANFMIGLKNKSLSKIESQNKEFESTISEIEKIQDIGNDLSNLEKNLNTALESQVPVLTSQFETIHAKTAEILKNLMLGLTDAFEKMNKKITENVDQLTADFETKLNNISKKIFDANLNQVKEVVTQIRKIKGDVSLSVQTLKLGVLQKAVDQVVAKSLNEWLKQTPASLLKPIKEIQDSSQIEIQRTKEKLNEYFNEIKKVNVDGILMTSLDINKQLKLIQDVSSEGVKQTTKLIETNLFQDLRKSIETPINRINIIAASSINSGNILKQIFNEISQDFNETISSSGEEISKITKDITVALSSLREIYKTKVVATFDKVLESILKKLDYSQVTIKEFWEQSKKATSVKTTIVSMKQEQSKLLEEYEKLKVELKKFASAAEEAKDTEYNFDKIKALLAIYSVLIEQIYSGSAEYKVLLTLHGEKEVMTKDELKNTTGIGGAFILNAINGLNRVGLVIYNPDTQAVKLKRRLFPKEILKK